MNTNVKNVATISPPTTALAKGKRSSAPSPIPKAIGLIARIVVKAVIKTGRILVLPP